MKNTKLINVAGWAHHIGISYHRFKSFIEGKTKHPRYNEDQLQKMEKCIEEAQNLLEHLKKVNESYKHINSK